MAGEGGASGSTPASPSGGAAGQDGAAGAGMTGPDPHPRTCEDQTTLREAGECTSRLIGTAVPASKLSDSTFTNILTQEFNYVTPENEMKWANIEPSRNNYSYGPADQIVNFALDNGMQVKGHTLVWHSQLPAWVDAINDPEDLRNAMVSHIQNLLDHYRGKVHAWDVVNEAWANPNDWPNGTPTLRNSVFMRVLGESFIDEAFIAAREADPEIKLYYNDFRSEAVGQPKGDAIYEMVKGMVERGVPIDGVGLQVHLGLPNDKPAIEDVIANMQRLADLGLEVLVSEMDDHVCDGETPEEQGVRFHDIAAACVAQPACPAFTVWGIRDGDSWLNSWNELDCMGRRPAGLLWDDNYMKKPAYHGVLDALNGQ
jgi:endo-1,4-beta-xylanase